MYTSFRKIYSPSFSTYSRFYFSRNVCRRMFSTQVAVAEEEVLQTPKGVRYIIRSLTHADVSKLLDLREEMLSIDCTSCLHSWLKSDPQGIKVAITTDGEIAGTCSGVMNGDNDEDGICFGGAFFVQAKYQGQGIGKKLFSSGMKNAGERNAGLNAVPGMLEVYRQPGGLPLHDTRFTIFEYETTSWPLDFSSFSDTPPPGVDIHPFNESHLPGIFDYDVRLLGFRRTTNMGLNIAEEGSTTLVALGGGGTVVGFGTVKITCRGAVRIGPLYADDPKVAEVLLRRLAAVHREGTGFVIVTTSGNLVLNEWCGRLGIEINEKCDRLYTKTLLNVDLNKVFAMFDLNFAPF